MSINLALANALSGLSAAARVAEVLSSNLANAQTDGYARRVVDLSAASLDGRGAGVRVDGVSRLADDGLIADRRDADARLADRRGLATALRGLEGELGAPGGGDGLSARLRALEEAFVSASADPSSETRLAIALDRLHGVAGGLRDGAAAIQTRRAEADADIARQVAGLDDALSGIARLNADIVAARATGRDATGLMDQRHLLLDRVAEAVPIRAMDRPGGAIALVTPRGAMLVDGARAAAVGFVPAGTVTAEMTLASGGLAGLTLDGEPVGADGVGRLAGGSLGAAFALRDATLPAVGARLDDLARDLVERMADPAADPSLGGGPGLLTDAGGPPGATLGLAGRIAVHASVDPARGGSLWRLRDGAGAAAPGPAGDAAQILRWSAALARPRVPAWGGPPAGAAALASGVESDLAARRLAAEEGESFASARQSSLREAELAQGVDSDVEMQALLVVEKAYAANARVIAALDGMLQTVLEI